MRKSLWQKWTSISLQAFFDKGKKQIENLLPSAEAQRAVQLPGLTTPFDLYRRQKLIRMLRLHELASEKSVLEIGCGIGDVLLEASKFNPRELYGVDPSREMIELAQQLLAKVPATLSVAESHRLPFPEKSFDLVIVMFELQFVKDAELLEKMICEATRICRQWLILVEETAPNQEVKDELTLRPVSFYKSKFGLMKFHLRQTTYLDDSASRFFFMGSVNPLHWIRWAFSPLLYLMGFPKAWMKPPSGKMEPFDSPFALFLQKLTLPFSKSLDEIFKPEKGITAMRFERERLFKRG